MLAEETNLADFWGSFQDLVFKIEIANYLNKFRLFLYYFFDTLKGVELTFIVKYIVSDQILGNNWLHKIKCLAFTPFRRSRNPTQWSW